MKVGQKSKCNMVFVVGNSRSGTTVMGRLLGLNSEVFTFNELHFFEEMWSPNSNLLLSDSEAVSLCAKLLNVQHNDYIGKKDFHSFEQEATQVLRDEQTSAPSALDIFRICLQYIARQNNKTIACDQTPRNVFYLNEILSAYPDACVINMVRDPRAVMLSQKNRWKIRSLGADNFPVREVLRSWTNYHPITTALLWNSAIRAAAKFEPHPRVKTVRYEDFVENPSVVVRDICTFIGIDFEPGMLEIPQEGGGISSFKRTDVKQKPGIDSSPAYRWKQGGVTTGEVMYCQTLSGAEMERFGYSGEKVIWWKAILWALFYAVTLPVQLGLAFALNFNRHKNLITSIRRRLFSGR